jgi:Restriction endonuclease
MNFPTSPTQDFRADDALGAKREKQGRRVVAVQIKQYPTHRKIMQRSVDELRGVCLRNDASEGLLITTSSYSPAITGTGSLVAPLYLMDGSELTFLLAQYRIGVTNSYDMDEQFFSDLEKASQDNTESKKQDGMKSKNGTSRRTKEVENVGTARGDHADIVREDSEKKTTSFEKNSPNLKKGTQQIKKMKKAMRRLHLTILLDR